MCLIIETTSCIHSLTNGPNRAVVQTIASVATSHHVTNNKTSPSEIKMNFRWFGDDKVTVGSQF